MDDEQPCFIIEDCVFDEKLEIVVVEGTSVTLRGCTFNGASNAITTLPRPITNADLEATRARLVALEQALTQS